jgi:hypothetical protein
MPVSTYPACAEPQSRTSAKPASRPAARISRVAAALPPAGAVAAQ